MESLKRELGYDAAEVADQELEELMGSLEKYAVKLPSADEIERTVEFLQQYVPEKPKARREAWKSVRLLEKAFDEVSFMSANFWIASTGLFLAGFLVMLLNGGYVLNGNNPYMLAMLLSPIPFVLGILEVFKGREEGVLELELSCKNSIAEIMVSRLIVVCVYSIFLNSIMTAAMVGLGADVMLWRVTLMWLTPFTLVAGLGLAAASRMRGSYVVVIFTSTWMILFMSLLAQDKVMERLLGIDLAAYAVLCVLGGALLVIQTIRFGQRNGRYYEGSVLNEAKY